MADFDQQYALTRQRLDNMVLEVGDFFHDHFNNWLAILERSGLSLRVFTGHPSRPEGVKVRWMYPRGFRELCSRGLPYEEEAFGYTVLYWTNSPEAAARLREDFAGGRFLAEQQYLELLQSQPHHLPSRRLLFTRQEVAAMMEQLRRNVATAIMAGRPASEWSVQQALAISLCYTTASPVYPGEDVRPLFPGRTFARITRASHLASWYASHRGVVVEVRESQDPNYWEAPHLGIILKRDTEPDEGPATLTHLATPPPRAAGAPLLEGGEDVPGRAGS